MGVIYIYILYIYIYVCIKLGDALKMAYDNYDKSIVFEVPMGSRF